MESNSRNEITAALELLQAGKPAKRKIKPVAISKEARKRWQSAHDNWLKENYKEAVKAGGLYAAKMPTLNANGLTRFICMYLQWQGWRATRVSSAGRMVDGKFIPSTTKAGSADISSTIQGKSIMWEVKINTDRPSPAQLAEQERERKAGGEYFFVHTPDEFFQLYDTLIENLTERDCNTCLDMATMVTGSICLTDLMEKAKEGHSAFMRGQNGKVYVNILQWYNDEADKFGNTVSIQLNSKKEKRELEGKIYIGNAKPLQSAQQPAQAAPAPSMVADDWANDLPF